MASAICPHVAKNAVCSPPAQAPRVHSEDARENVGETGLKIPPKFGGGEHLGKKIQGSMLVAFLQLIILKQ